MIDISSADKALLTLVSAGLWEQDFSEPLALDGKEWQEVLVSAKNQTVLGLVYKGLEHIPAGSTEPSDHAYLKLAVDVEKCEARNARMAQAQKTIFEEFMAAGLHPIQLKGQSVAKLYACPELRQSGDIDIWFSAEEFDKAVPDGAQIASDGSAEYLRDDVIVEHHRQLLDIANPSKQELIDRLIDRYGFADGTTSPELTILLLATHILKHVLGRGVGLRQICDYARASKVLTYDHGTMIQTFHDLGLGRWMAVLNSFCTRYLGADMGDEEPVLADRLLGIVLDGGNFGQHSGRGEGAWNTFLAFFSNIGFSLKVAPGEAFWNVAELVKGRLKKHR